MTWPLESDLEDLKLMIAFHELLVAVDTAVRNSRTEEIGRGRGKPVENCAIIREQDFIGMAMAYRRLRDKLKWRDPAP